MKSKHKLVKDKREKFENLVLNSSEILSRTMIKICHKIATNNNKFNPKISFDCWLIENQGSKY